MEASKKPLRRFSWEEMLQKWAPLGEKAAGLGGGLGEPQDTEGRNLWGMEEASISYLQIHTKPVSLWASGFLVLRRPSCGFTGLSFRPRLQPRPPALSTLSGPLAHTLAFHTLSSL